MLLIGSRHAGRRFMRRRIFAVTIAAALFGVVAAPAVAQNSASAAAGPIKSKPEPRTSPGGTVTVKVTAIAGRAM
jgi:hypothetical protein